MVGKRIYLKKHYLLWDLKDVIDIENISELRNSFLNKFEKNVTFRKVYSFLKKHKQTNWNKTFPMKLAPVKYVKSLNQL